MHMNFDEKAKFMDLQGHVNGELIFKLRVLDTHTQVSAVKVSVDRLLICWTATAS